MTPTYRVHFLGCKANQSDALSYAGLLHRAGWAEAPDGIPASLAIVQTCAVTMSADAQGRQLARRIKRENSQTKVLLTGCSAQHAERELLQMPEVDYVIGNLHPRKFEMLSIIAGKMIAETFSDFPMPAETPRTRPYIKIQDGCDARCSYCIIPSVRGRSRSLPPEEVLRRIELYRDRGYREMILTGISMGGYGKDLSPRTSLSQLMKRIDALEGQFKIRLSSLEPEEIDDEFVQVFSAGGRFQPHLHLPLQSASDKVLKRMRRQYLFRRYDSILNQINARKPDVSFGTDILVGFPDEDRDAFEETCRYLDNAPFSYAHVFPFSPRPGTAARNYKPAASHQEITERAAKLRCLAKKKNISYRKKFIGRNLDALWLHGTREALTGNYIRVQLDPFYSSNFESIRIDRVEDNQTRGTAVQKRQGGFSNARFS